MRDGSINGDMYSKKKKTPEREELGRKNEKSNKTIIFGIQKKEFKNNSKTLFYIVDPNKKVLQLKRTRS